jgi:IclR family acetate operon transcriptional repressor
MAQESGDLVRLAIVDGDRLTFVAKAQGARNGLRYDPDMGIDVRLSCSAAGHAWMATLDDERVIALIAQQGFGAQNEYGPRAPTTYRELLEYLEQARTRGFSMISDVYSPGMASIAAPIRWNDGPTVGVVSIAGPLMRLTEERMLGLGPRLVKVAAELAIISRTSPLFDTEGAPAQEPTATA